ncbi:expressed unknown protein [Seminavis robusta]|uniref:Uncharacterized protein n=1 Tax=Seminavis robusta TaxID=568900 RepID=A0A9N8HB88_9STRA|nr:expressed unknown protein [Seminavis robusta]|eukprot:Sro174_g076670.1 n/a (234) ;mRNA; r:51891-52592
MDERLLDLGVPLGVQVQGGDDVAIREDPPGCCVIAFDEYTPYLSFADLSAVLPSIGHRYTSLLIFVNCGVWDLEEDEALHLGTLIQAHLGNLQHATFDGYFDVGPRTILVQHLPRQLLSLAMKSCDVQQITGALAHIPSHLPGLKSLTLEVVDYHCYNESDTAGIISSLSRSIQLLPDLESLCMARVESIDSGEWNLVVGAITCHDKIKVASFRQLYCLDSDRKSNFFTFDKD